MKNDKRPNKECIFGQLDSGDVFIYQNIVYMKTGYLEDWDTEAAVNLEDGEIMDFLAGTKVEKTPNAELTWTI